MTLEDGLRDHLLASPILLTLAPADPRETHLADLTDVRQRILIAEVGGEPVAYLRIGPHSDDVTELLQDEGTAAITGAYTVPGWRSTGVAASLLEAAIDWARSSGYERCGVDFESANLEGSRFWFEHFQPVSVAFVRRLGPEAGRVVG